MGERRYSSLLVGTLLIGTAWVPAAISACQIFLYPVVAAFLVMLPRLRGEAVPRTPMVWGFAVFLIGTVVASCLGLDPFHSLHKTHRLFIFMLMFAVPWVAAQSGHPGSSLVPRLLAALVVGVVLLSIKDAWRIPHEVAEGVRMWDTGNMRDPQFYMTGLLIVVGLRVGGRWRIGTAGWVLIVAVFLLGLLLHNKRGSWISTLIGMSFLLMVCGRWRTILAMLTGVLVLLAGVEGLHQAGVVPPDLSPVQRLAALSEEDDPGHGGRLSLWRGVAPALLEEFPNGVGYRGTTYDLFRAYTHDVQPGLEHLHNNLLQILVESGWIGGVGWLIWMGTTLVLGIRAARAPGEEAVWGRILLAVFLALMCNGVVEYNFGDTEILFLYGLVFGMINLVSARK